MPNISDQIRIDAFKYVQENNIAALTALIDSYRDLVNVRSQRDNSTLFIRACEYLKKDIIELLLNKGADPFATNNNGNNGIMYLFYRSEGTVQFNTDINAHDYKAVAILELLKDKKIPINCFVAQDADKDTPLIEAVRAKLLECSKFMIKLLKEYNLLEGQFLHQNNNGQDICQLTSEEFLDKMLNEEQKIFLPFEIAKFHVNEAVRVSSPTTQEKDKLLSLIKEYLPKLNIKQVESLANIIFQEELYNETTGTDSTYHRKNLQKEYSSGNFGVKIFNSIDVKLIELLYVAGGVNLLSYKNFIESLTSLKDENLNSNGMCSAVILESNKQKILQIIKSSNTLTLLQNQKDLDCKEEDIVVTKDFALKRFCFLAANNEKLEISEKSEAGILLEFINWGNNIESYHYNIFDNFKKYLVEEAKTCENFKKILNIHGDKIAKIIQFEDKLVSKLKELGENFEDNVDILTNEIEKLLNPSLEYILPKDIFLRSIDDKKEEKINENDKKLLEDNLKFFTVPSIFQVPEYDKLNQETFQDSIKYYKNNSDALIPNLVLLKTTNDEVKLSKLREVLNSHYVKAKSTVGNCLNVILDGQKYLKSLEIADLDITLDKQNLVDKLPLLTDKIKESLHSSEVENVKNITLLCKEVKDFLNISPIASVFEEYDNKYQALESEISNTEKVLGEIGIEWSFS